MANHGYNQPSEGSIDWHIPLNENFKKLERDVEVRDLEANRSDYQPAIGAKFLATDSGATYTGDGTNWNLVGYVSRAGGGDFGHFVNYEAGLAEEPINMFFFDSDERLEVVRASVPVKGLSQGTTDSDVTLRVHDGGIDGEVILELSGNEYVSVTDDTGPWIAGSSPAVVTISNSGSESVDVVPKVWANIRR